MSSKNYIFKNLLILKCISRRRKTGYQTFHECFFRTDRGYCENPREDNIMPEEPTNCCMSGCANCVWIEYGEKLIKYYKSKYKDGGARATAEILSKMSDPNMKAFLQFEMRMLELTKK